MQAIPVTRVWVTYWGSAKFTFKPCRLLQLSVFKCKNPITLDCVCDAKQSLHTTINFCLICLHGNSTHLPERKVCDSEIHLICFHRYFHKNILMLNTTKHWFKILIQFYHDLIPLLLINSPCSRSYQMQHAQTRDSSWPIHLISPYVLPLQKVKKLNKKPHLQFLFIKIM